MRKSYFSQLIAGAMALALSAFAQDTQPPAAATAPAAAAAAKSPLTQAGIDFSFLLDGYGSLNFNNPDSKFNQLHNYDFRGNSTHLSLGKIAMEHAPDPIGFRLDVGFGETLNWNSSTERSPEWFRYFQQAYVSFKPKSFHGVQIDVGKFNTSVGTELIESILNYNYSRSYLFSWGAPYYHTGIRTTVPVGKFTGGFQVLQGWNSVYDNNSGKTFGFTGAYAWKKVTWNNAYLVGPEKSGTNDGVRHLYDTNVVLTPTEKVSAYIEFLYGQDGKPGGGSNKWGGVAGAVQYKTSAKTAIAGRLDFFKDADGFSTGTVQDIKEVTLTADYKIQNWLLARGEFRHDWSNQPYFSKEHGQFGTGQPTLLLGIVAYFTPKK
jgi:Putative beta-barrel porin-2, OmpL-like. bbp2